MDFRSARSGCHSNVTEVKAVLFQLFYLFTYNFACFGFFAFVSVVSFRSFWWFRLGCFVSLFWVLVHAHYLKYRERYEDYDLILFTVEYI